MNREIEKSLFIFDKIYNMKKYRKIGYIDISANLIELLSNKYKGIVFCDVRKTRYKMYDIILHSDLLSDSEKSLYELFNTFLINVGNSTIENIQSKIKDGLRYYRPLDVEDELYIKVINKFYYLNEKVEKLVDKNNSHSLNVAYLVKKFCDKTHLTRERTLELYIAALFHDIGKIYVDPKILCKKGKLTKEEYDKVKVHPLKGYELLHGYLPEKVLLIIKNHHKRENNIGYPNDQEELDDWTRIISLSDSYDAIVSKRVYSEPLSKKDGVQELIICSKDESDGGKGLFNPYITELFVKTL